ncbi:MAG: hypothetical protein ABIH23_09160 [bacterium]
MIYRSKFHQHSKRDRMGRMHYPLSLLICLVMALIWVAQTAAAPLYMVVVDPAVKEHPAVQGMLDVFLNAIEHEGWEFSEESRRISQRSDGFFVHVGLAEVPISESSQGFRFSREKGRWFLRGSSPSGVAAGLVWLADRISATGRFPEETVVLSPAFKRHFANIQPPSDILGDESNPGFSKEEERTCNMLLEAVLYGATDLLTYGRNQLAWVGSGEAPEEVLQRRAAYKNYIRLAHDFGLRVFLVGDELIYREDWFKAAGAELCTQDPQLWEMLREKIRSVLSAVPEADGILVRTGEVIPRGELKSFDLVHHRCEREKRSIELIYQQIIQTVYGVVVGEYGKEYIHRTWVTSSHEQHSIAEVFQRIFTDEIPTENLIVSIKLTRTDQWQFQQLNPTFGQSPHRTNVEIETARFQRWGSPIMDFAAERVASGMQFALHRGATSVSNSIWSEDSASVDAARYMIWRFAWNPDADVRGVVCDWTARRFGRKHATQVADVFLSLDKAVRNAWYVRPLAVTHWNPSPHVYVDRFALKGLPPWDRGAGQDRFLYELYLQAKPWIEDTLEEMDMGVEVWTKARDSFSEIVDELDDSRGARKVIHDLERGTYALKLNRAYMATVFACYAYRENPTSEKRQLLGERIEALKKALIEHKDNDGFYGTTPIEVFLDVATKIHEDIDKAKAELASAPNQDEIHEMMQQTAEKDRTLLAQHLEAKAVFRWSATLDGRDILYVTERECRIEHFVADPAGGIQQEFLAPFPQKGQYLIRRIQGRGYIYLMESPTPENNLTAKILVDDPLPSSDVHTFELCVIP